MSGVEEVEVADGDAEVAIEDADLVDGKVEQRQDVGQKQETAKPSTSRWKKSKPNPPPPLWVEVSDVGSAEHMPVWLDFLP